MSYDLAVWEGDQPSDDKAGAATHEELYAKYIHGENATDAEPTPAIRAYVEALLERWPIPAEDEEEDDDDFPWSAWPLINEASGPYIYFAMRWSMATEVSAEAAAMAAKRGLVCFDPQLDRLRPAAEERSVDR